MLLYPKFYCDSVRDVGLDFLKKNNIKGIILDVDNTLINFYKEFEEGTVEWVQSLKNAGIKFCVVSNSNKKDKVKQTAEKIDVPYFYFAKKPFKFRIFKSEKINGARKRKYCCYW